MRQATLRDQHVRALSEQEIRQPDPAMQHAQMEQEMVANYRQQYGTEAFNEYLKSTGQSNGLQGFAPGEDEDEGEQQEPPLAIEYDPAQLQ